MCDHSWLPPEERFEDDGGGWPAYWDRLYAIFCRDLVAQTPILLGQRVYVPTKMGDDGKLERFTHVATGHWKLDPENPREIKLDRCATVPWIRPIIDAAATSGRAIRVWKEWYQEKREFRWHLTLEEFCHLVVLAESPRGLFLVSAYPVDRRHQRESLQERFLKATGAPIK